MVFEDKTPREVSGPKVEQDEEKYIVNADSHNLYFSPDLDLT
jgi:hypothetical protein